MKNLKKSESSFSSIMMLPEIEDSEKKKILSNFKMASPKEFELMSRLSDDDIYQILFAPIWLNVKWHYNCYYVYAEYYFEAWTTSTADSNGPRTPVNQIEIYWRHGGTRGHEVKNNADMVAKSDRTYNLGCDTDMCVSGRATHNGISWGVNNPTTCVP